jgi:hypothetical protein
MRMGTEKGSIQRRQPGSVIRKGLGEFLPTRSSHIMSSGNDRCYLIEPFMFSGRYTYRPPKRPEDHLGIV